MLLKKKWIIGGGVLIVVLFILISLTLQSNSSKDNNVDIQPTISIQPTEYQGSHPTYSPEVQQAVDKQVQADQEYSAIQKNLHDDYPWLRKFPLTSEKYFVYFDLDKKTFIGRLYPTATDNVEQIKIEITNELKNNLKVATENYQFQWTVFPK